MILSFRDRGTEEIYNGLSTARARRKCPESLWSVAQRKLDILNRAADLEDLRVPPGNALQELKGDRRGLCSIRINERYRICFVWTDEGPTEVEIVDYH